MIISASRRTDLPAFHAKWFMNRIREGFFNSVNPFRPSQQRVVSLKPTDVEAIVFWTKYPRPLLAHLPDLDMMGYRYYFQFTLLDYPDIFEPRVPPLQERINVFQRLSKAIGRDKVIWRYDPIILSNRTSKDYHLEKFGLLTGTLAPYTTRVMISFLDFYGKVKARLKKLGEYAGLKVFDVEDEVYREDLFALMEGFSAIAKEAGLAVYSCAEKIDLSRYSINHGACIDQDLLHSLFGLSQNLNKDKHQRADCRCVESVDLGLYNTCPFNCLYCYANRSEPSAQNDLRDS